MGHSSSNMDRFNGAIYPDVWLWTLVVYNRQGDQMTKIHVYTDGSCKRNPGPGGWAAIIQYINENNEITIQRELSGGQKDTTNNQMELRAVIEGLRTLPRGSVVTIHTDSEYITKNVPKLMDWKINNWRTLSADTEVKNKVMWANLLDLIARHNVDFVKVKAHGDNVMNNYADKLASDSSARADQ